jgi:tight adherence protein B
MAILQNPIVLIGGGIVLLLIIGILIFALGGGRKDVSDRLDRFAGRGEEAPSAEADAKKKGRGKGTSALTDSVDKAIAGRSFAGKIQRDLAQANLKFTVAEFIGLRIIAAIVGGVIGYVIEAIRQLGAAVVLIGIGLVIGYYAPSIYMRQTKNRRLRAFNNQLGDTITLLANSLRSGYSLLQSMEMVSREAPPPVSEEFRRVVQEVGLGLSTQDALANLLRRVPSDDLDLMITAINIQHEVGGNLAQILDTIGHTIRERVRIKGEIRVLVAQQRISGYVVAALPIMLAVILAFITPSFMAPLFTIGLPPFVAEPGKEGWICMPICAGLLMMVGFIIIQRIVNIEV